MITAFSAFLQQRLPKELPGKKAHLEVAPYRKIDFDEQDIVNAKKSAVLILFYAKENEIQTVLMQRTTYDGTHSGQISFPGGKVEKIDKTIIETALREANEEIGVVADKIKIVGQLTDVFIPVSNFHVVPIIGISKEIPIFTIDTREVASILEFKMNDLMQQELLPQQIKLANNSVINVPTFNCDNKIIWGATALMLNEIKHIIADWKF